MLNLLRTIGWGLFLASSWTWCVGIYLPKILIDRFGWPGFIAFAIPNIFGAALFGYVVRSRERSRRLVEMYGHAMAWFSIVTLIFHVFFLIFIGRSVDFFGAEPSKTVFILPFGVLTAAMILSVLPRHIWPWLGSLVWLVSIAAFVGVGTSAFGTISWRGEFDPAAVGWLVPIVCFGFLLCPYLDLTFHRALDRSPSRHAFAIFGVTFAAMLLLSCAIWFGRFELLPAAAIVHILVQITFTMAVHFREMQFSNAFSNSRMRTLAFALPLAGIPIAMAADLGADPVETGKAIYIRFLVFYALLFPAYAIVFMEAWAPVARTKRNLVIFFIVIAAMAPFCEIGFVRGEMWALGVPAATIAAWVVVLAVRRTRGMRS